VRLGSAVSLAALVIFAFSVTAGAARRRPVVSAGDVAATRAYLRAKEVEVRAEVAAYPAAIKTLEALDERLAGECPGVLAGAPHHVKGAPVKEPEANIIQELLITVLGAPERSEHAIMERFARTVGHLRWSKGKLTRLVHSYAAERAAQSALRPPNLCADLKAWVTSGYRTISADTTRYMHQLQAISRMTLIESEPGEGFTFDVDKIIARRLAPYEDRADKATLHRTRRLQAKQKGPLLAGFIAAIHKIYRVLESTTPVASK
jgi:hypothetical protein